MKSAFFSTSNRSIAILETLNKFTEVVLCVTKPDVVVGRKREVQKNEIAEWAKKQNITCLQVGNLKNENLEGVLEQLNTSNIDLIVVVDFAFIIPKTLIEKFGKKLVNIHFSLLPKYRGSSPAQFAILNGDEKTGITYQYVSEKFDAGDVLRQIEYNLTNKETSGELYNQLFKLASDDLPQFLEKYEKGELTPLLQKESEASYTYSSTQPTKTFTFKEDALISWSDSVEKIERMIRAYNPWPIAWTYLKDFEKSLGLIQGKIKLKDSVNKELKLKIYETEVNSENKLDIKKLQVEGKNVMSWKDFQNGYLVI